MTHALLAKQSEAAPASQCRTGSSGLRVNRPGDVFEQEAERASEQVVSGRARNAAGLQSRLSPPAALQRECACGGQCEDCKKKKEEMLQREATVAAAPAFAPSIVNDVLRGSGSRMDEDTRNFMESRFGYDFSSVRIYSDPSAAHSAHAVSANAYTVGEKIVFNQGRYAPGTHGGQRLLAHELAHVVQQSLGSAPAQIQRDSNDIETIDAPKSNSVLQQAFDAADARQWEKAARLANGLSPYEMSVFLSQYPEPMWRHQLHLGAVRADGVGDNSAIALATEKESADFKKKEDFKYRQQLAKQNGEPPPKEDDITQIPNTPPKPLTAEDKKRQCASSDTKGVMTFPLRLPRGLWRISVAPINARRSGKDIVVSQPLNGVLGDPMFKNEVKTLPLSTFTGGVHIAPDDYVRVRFYDDDDRVACVSGEEMLKLSSASDTAVMLSIARTALDAASVIAPGAGQALVNRGFSAAAARLTVAGANLALNEGLEVTQQYANVQYGVQDQIHWGQIAFDTVLQAVTIGLGGKLTEAAADRVASVASGTYTKPLLKVAVETVMQGSIAVFQSVARTLFNRLQGENRPMTFGQYMEELAGEFAQGALFHLVMQAIPEGEGAPHTDEHGNPKSAKAAVETNEHQTPTPATKEHDNGAPPTAKIPPVKSGMDNDATASLKAIPKEEALATVEIEDPKTHEKHEIVGSKRGIGRCSDSPCPAIPVVYAKELAENPAFAARYKKIREVGKTNVPEATNQAATLANDIEAYKLAALGRAAAVSAKLAPELAQAEAELNQARKSTVDYQEARRNADKSLKGGPIKGIWNAKERLWILKRQIAFPDRTILEQARIVGVKGADGTIKPASTISTTGRTLDFVELRGTEVVGGDLKSGKELISSIKGGLGSEGIPADFRGTSKIAGQHKVEGKIVAATSADNSVIVVEGRNVLTGATQTIEVPASKYRSEVLTYEDVRPN